MFQLFNKDEEVDSYFKTFRVISEYVVEMVDLLFDYFNEDSLDSLKEALAAAQRIEKEVKNQQSQLLHDVYDDFLPPIERKDITALTYALERVLKNVTELLVHLDIYQIQTVQPQMRQLLEVIGEVTREMPQLMEALADFKHPQEIKKILEKVYGLNTQGAKIYREGIKELSLGEMNSFETMKYTRIYECLTAVLQAVDELMKTVTAVIIQNT